jgi:hypothetical protein
LGSIGPLKESHKLKSLKSVDSNSIYSNFIKPYAKKEEARQSPITSSGKKLLINLDFLLPALLPVLH